MTEHIAALAPDNLPDIEYSRVNEEQASYIHAAMDLPENRDSFDVSFLPIETPEQRREAAEEWAGYKQAAGNVRAREMGAVLIFGGRDESPEALLALLEDADRDDSDFVTHALMKVVKKNPDASTYLLLRDYYEHGES